MNHATNFFLTKRELGIDRGSPNQKVKRNIYWYHGTTATGKTFIARNQMNRLAHDLHCSWIDFPIQNGGSNWFDPKVGEARIFLFEELRGGSLQLNHLLMLFDQYSCTLPIKGGLAPWNAEFIFVTTPYSPQETFRFVENEKINQLIRRLKVIAEFRHDEWWGYQVMLHKGSREDLIEPLWEEEDAETAKLPTIVGSW
jgi:hypothetical protein